MSVVKPWLRNVYGRPHVPVAASDSSPRSIARALRGFIIRTTDPGADSCRGSTLRALIGPISSSVPTSSISSVTIVVVRSASLRSSTLTAALSYAPPALLCVTFSICRMACDTCSMPCDC